MIRKLKIASTLAAAVALFAMTTSAAQAQFTSAGYPATITGSSTNDVMDMFGSTVKCTNTTFSGTLSAASETFTLKPIPGGCSAFGLPATVDFTGCDWVLHKRKFWFDYETTVCSAGKAIDINVYSSAAHSTALCHLTVPAQTEKTGYTLTNGAGTVTISGSVTGLTAEQNRTSIACPAGTSTTAATYTIQAGGIVLSGNNGAISVD